MQLILVKVGIILSLIVLPMAALAGQASPSMLADACAACHGTDGKSPSTIPSIQGKSANYLIKRLKEFKSGTRDSTVMSRIVKGYSDAEIEAMAKFLASK